MHFVKMETENTLHIHTKDQKSEELCYNSISETRKESSMTKYDIDSQGNKCEFVGVYRNPTRKNQRIPIHKKPDGTFITMLNDSVPINLSKMVKINFDENFNEI